LDAVFRARYLRFGAVATHLGIVALAGGDDVAIRQTVIALEIYFCVGVLGLCAVKSGGCATLRIAVLG